MCAGKLCHRNDEAPVILKTQFTQSCQLLAKHATIRFKLTVTNNGGQHPANKTYRDIIIVK